MRKTQKEAAGTKATATKKQRPGWRLSPQEIHEIWTQPDLWIDERTLEATGLLPRTLAQRLRWQGLGPRYCKIGHAARSSVRYQVRWVLEWIASQTVEPGETPKQAAAK